MTTPEAIRLLERWAEARADEPDFGAAVRHAVIAMRILADLCEDLPWLKRLLADKDQLTNKQPKA